MTDLSYLGRVETADILVIGGGIGGLVAAVAAKEKNADADVLVVERATPAGPARPTRGPASGGTSRRRTTPTRS